MVRGEGTFREASRKVEREPPGLGPVLINNPAMNGGVCNEYNQAVDAFLAYPIKAFLFA